VKKKIFGGVALVLLLLAGALVGYVLYKRHESRNIRGSSTQEFVTTETPTKPAPKPPGVIWPTYGYDNARVKAVAGFRRLVPPYRVDWAFRARKLLEFPPTIAYGRLFIANNAGTLFAINDRTGRPRWTYRSGRCTAATPAVDHHVVFQVFMNKPPCNAQAGTAGLDGQVVALVEKNGHVRWRRTIGPSETSPAVANGRVYVGDWTGRVYALDERTGRTIWTFATGGQVKGGVAVDGNRVYVGSYDGHVYALNARTGHEFWRASAQARLGSTGTFYATPAAAYGRVYIGSTDHKVYSFGATSGKLRWSHSTGSYVYSSPAVYRLRVYVGSYDGGLYCFDAATGDVKWRFDAHAPISGAPTVVNGIVYFSTLKTRTFGLDARTGKLLWQFPDGQYTPVVADSKTLFLVGYSRLFALKPRPRR
jgi:outer membrane protein assembly factor BamB